MRELAVAVILTVLTLASLAGSAAADAVEVDADATGPDGGRLTPGNARNALVHVALRVDADGDGEAESEVLRGDLDVRKVEPGAPLASRLDVHFYRADGSETEPGAHDAGSVADVRQVHAGLGLDTDGEEGDDPDQAMSARTPPVASESEE